MPGPLPSAKSASDGYPTLRKLRRHYRRKRRKKQVKTGKPCNSFLSFLRKYGHLRTLAQRRRVTICKSSATFVCDCRYRENRRPCRDIFDLLPMPAAVSRLTERKRHAVTVANAPNLSSESRRDHEKFRRCPRRWRAGVAPPQWPRCDCGYGYGYGDGYSYGYGDGDGTIGLPGLHRRSAPPALKSAATFQTGRRCAGGGAAGRGVLQPRAACP